MSGDDNNVELKHPLSLWEKIKIGVGSFFKGAASYIPRALIMTPLMLGGMVLLINATGWTGPFGMLEGLANLDLAGFATKAAIGIGLGSALIGGFSAYQGVVANTEFRNKEIELQEHALARAHSQQRQRQQFQAYTGGYVPQRGLPSMGNESELSLQ
jgi:hypothetical protein